MPTMVSLSLSLWPAFLSQKVIILHNLLYGVEEGVSLVIFRKLSLASSLSRRFPRSRLLLRHLGGDGGGELGEGAGSHWQARGSTRSFTRYSLREGKNKQKMHSEQINEFFNNELKTDQLIIWSDIRSQLLSAWNKRRLFADNLTVR